MKKTYYLFNPGRLSRKDNTLVFTPVDETGMEQKPRFIPIEMVDQLYVFGSLDANSALFNFLGKNQVCVHFLIITKTIQDRSTHANTCWPAG